MLDDSALLEKVLLLIICGAVLGVGIIFGAAIQVCDPCSPTPTLTPVINFKYPPSDLIGANINDSCLCIIPEHDRETDQYKDRFILKSDDEWVYAAENDTSVWTEECYPCTLDHSIPEHNEADTIRSVSTLEDELRVLHLEDFYKENECDCSELSAYLEWWLESRGVHAYIVEGAVSAHPEISEGEYIYEEGEGGPHAWVEAEIEGEPILIESTGCFRVPDKLKLYYIEERRFEDLQTLLTYYYEEGYDVMSALSEYDWWTVLTSKNKERG